MPFAVLVVDDDPDTRDREALRASEQRLAAEAAALERLSAASSRLWGIHGERAGLAKVLAATIELLGADMGNVQLLDAGRARPGTQRRRS